jgi:hypothetical protein
LWPGFTHPYPYQEENTPNPSGRGLAVLGMLTVYQKERRTYV